MEKRTEIALLLSNKRKKAHEGFTGGPFLWYNTGKAATFGEYTDDSSACFPTFIKKEGLYMMYGNSRQRARMNQPDLLLQRRVLLIVCILLLGVVIALGFVAIRNGTYRDKAEMQFAQRMYTAAATAVNEVSRMDISTSSTSAQLARIRQNVYYMEQLNALSMSLAGGEAGRLAPEECFTQLDSDLDTFETEVQKSTNPLQNIRKQLQDHLTELQALLSD